jgi:hypothetical protein
MVVKLKYTVFATITMEKNVTKVQSNDAMGSGTIQGSVEAQEYRLKIKMLLEVCFHLLSLLAVRCVVYEHPISSQ